MVLGPLMLQMGLLPQVSTATTATMIVLTSSSLAVLYVVGGLVPWSYALVFFAVAFTTECSRIIFIRLHIITEGGEKFSSPIRMSVDVVWGAMWGGWRWVVQLCVGGIKLPGVRGWFR